MANNVMIPDTGNLIPDVSTLQQRIMPNKVPNACCGSSNPILKYVSDNPLTCIGLAIMFIGGVMVFYSARPAIQRFGLVDGLMIHLGFKQPPLPPVHRPVPRPSPNTPDVQVPSPAQVNEINNDEPVKKYVPKSPPKAPKPDKKPKPVISADGNVGEPDAELPPQSPKLKSSQIEIPPPNAETLEVSKNELVI